MKVTIIGSTKLEYKNELNCLCEKRTKKKNYKGIIQDVYSTCICYLQVEILYKL